MDNSVGKFFEFPLLKEELFVAFSLFLRSFVWLHTYIEEDKRTALSVTMIEITHRIRQKLTWILGLSDSSTLVALCV